MKLRAFLSYFGAKFKSQPIKIQLFYLPSTHKIILIAGNYTCQVEWSNSEPISVTHRLEVHVEPSIQYVRPVTPLDHSLSLDHPSGQDDMGFGQEGVVDVREGQNVTFECKSDGIPKPRIDWVRI